MAFNVAISSKCKIGSNVIIGSQTGISHCVRIGSNVTIGDACKIGQFAIIEDGTKVPDFTQIPAFTTFTINGEMIKKKIVSACNTREISTSLLLNLSVTQCLEDSNKEYLMKFLLIALLISSASTYAFDVMLTEANPSMEVQTLVDSGATAVKL